MCAHAHTRRGRPSHAEAAQAQPRRGEAAGTAQRASACCAAPTPGVLEAVSMRSSHAYLLAAAARQQPRPNVCVAAARALPTLRPPPRSSALACAPALTGSTSRTQEPGAGFVVTGGRPPSATLQVSWHFQTLPQRVRMVCVHACVHACARICGYTRIRTSRVDLKSPTLIFESWGRINRNE